VGVPARWFLRVRRHLLRLRPVCVGQAIGIFSASPRRHLRTGGTGGGPAYSLFCQLGGLAPAEPAAVATRSLRGQDPLGLGFLIWERIGIALDGARGAQAGTGAPDNNFVFTGSKAIGGVDMSAAALIGVCLSEHERRFSGYDARLLRPYVMPHLMRSVSRFLRWRGPAVATR
jgi:hypothetical protein